MRRLATGLRDRGHLLAAQVKCQACEIVMEPVLEWGNRDDPGILEGKSILVAMAAQFP